jgi:exonuclease III
LSEVGIHLAEEVPCVNIKPLLWKGLETAGSIQLRVISWNMNKRKSGCWEWLLEELKPDYVLAQEASPLPDGVKATTRTTTKKSNRSTFYSKENNHQKVKVKTDNGMGLIVSKAGEIHFICVYANLDFKPVDLPLLGLISSYVAHLRQYEGAKEILIAGDFNMDRRMDENPTGSVFATKDTYPTNNFFDAILDMGFQDCMRKFNAEPMQTHRHARSKFPWELDHMFATENLYERLNNIEVVTANTLSDHDPIVADFKL